MPAPLFDSLGMVTLHVTDYARAKRFYGDTLGLPLVFTDDEDAFVAYQLARDVQIGVHLDDLCREAGDGRRPGGVTGLMFDVRDVRATRAEFGARNVSLTQDLTDAPWGTWFAFEDPDGNEFVVVQWAES